MLLPHLLLHLPLELELGLAGLLLLLLLVLLDLKLLFGLKLLEPLDPLGHVGRRLLGLLRQLLTDLVLPLDLHPAIKSHLLGILITILI